MGTWGEQLSADSEVPSQPGKSGLLQHPRASLSGAISEDSEVLLLISLAAEYPRNLNRRLGPEG